MLGLLLGALGGGFLTGGVLGLLALLNFLPALLLLRALLLKALLLLGPALLQQLPALRLFALFFYLPGLLLPRLLLLVALEAEPFLPGLLFFQALLTQLLLLFDQALLALLLPLNRLALRLHRGLRLHGLLDFDGLPGLADWSLSRCRVGLGGLAALARTPFLLDQAALPVLLFFNRLALRFLRGLHLRGLRGCKGLQKALLVPAPVVPVPGLPGRRGGRLSLRRPDGNGRGDGFGAARVGF